jgi:hypothetical protein
MQKPNNKKVSLDERCDAATHRFRQAARRLQIAIKHNPNWHLQPRIPTGPDGGQWIAYVTAAAASLLPILQRLGPPAVRRLREIARRVGPLLRRLPKRWDKEASVSSEEDFDEETRRIGPPSWHRFGHPTIRFRSERELREYLGAAGKDREWHHIVEKRLADNGMFKPEQIHNTDNIINLPVEVHRRVSARMSSRGDEFGGEIQRFWVEKLSFGDQYNHGLDLIERTLEEFGYDPRYFL